MSGQRWYMSPHTGRVYEVNDATRMPSDVVAAFRPVVVIDPMDEEAVTRLANALVAKHSDRAYGVHQDWLAVQAALRELVNPKPNEPTGLGAVVEDADGEKWVRVDDPSHSWVRSMRAEGTYTSRSKWDAIAAVRVLSEGVPES